MVKVERSFPAPASLEQEKRKKSGTYRTAEVIERLKKDFHNKCYICEMGDLQDPEIEHLLPYHNGADREREFDWNNLFWSCRHCNLIKNQRKYDGGIINCCEEDPEQLIKLCFENNVLSASAKTDMDEQRIVNTEMLINEVFNPDKTMMRMISSQERCRLLQKEMITFYQQLRLYREHKHSRVLYSTIKGLLNRQSSFAQVKRDYIRSHSNIYPELLDLL